MKRWIWILLPVLLLCGCQAEETLETVNDEWMVPVMAQPRAVSVELPEDALSPVLEQDDRRLYMGQGYEIMLETLSSGDLTATVQTLCGYKKDQLTILQTKQDDLDRYEFVWTTAGEQGDRLGRAVILDDGDFHYCMSVLREPGDTTVAWRKVFGSFALI